MLNTILPLTAPGGVARTSCWAFAAAVTLTANVASAAPMSDPTGEWMVEKGYATIRIVDCNGQFWGIVASEQTPGGVDKNNPDPQLRSRPTLGMPVLKGMTPSNPNEWSGEIYNSQDGRTYSASISLLSADKLKVQGCVLGFLCGGENWTRVASPERTTSTTGAPPPGQRPGTSAARPTGPARPAPGARSAAGAAADQSPQTQPAEEICSALLGIPGSTHERRLK